MAFMANRRSLVLDGSLGYVVVAIVEERDGILSGISESVEFHQPILQRIDDILSGSTGRHEATEVVVGSGPGSYTGLRIAAAAAAGIAAGLSIPLRVSASDRALWNALGVKHSLPLGARESLEISSVGATVVRRDDASPVPTREQTREVFAEALARNAGPEVPFVTLQYPAPARGSNGQ
ncbi:MAG: hypothetical protein EBU83_02790 [bacterium]|nr:hypothetical protein [Candidatus Aquidulcis sp.]